MRTCIRHPLSRSGTERVRLTRPKPCLKLGAGSRGRPACRGGWGWDGARRGGGGMSQRPAFQVQAKPHTHTQAPDTSPPTCPAPSQPSPQPQARSSTRNAPDHKHARSPQRCPARLWRPPGRAALTSCPTPPLIPLPIPLPTPWNPPDPPANAFPGHLAKPMIKTT